MKRKQAIQGFTLIELLGVMVIILVLAGMVFGLASLAGRQSDEAKTRSKLKEVQNALDSYRAAFKIYPASNGDTFANLNQLIDDLEDLGLGELQASFFEDAWGNQFQYQRPSDKIYFLYSVGVDGVNESTFNNFIPQIGGDDIGANR